MISQVVLFYFIFYLFGGLKIVIYSLVVQESTYWRWEGEHEIGEDVLEDGSLALSNVTRLNTGRYVCHREEDDSVVRSFHVIVVGGFCA